MNKVIIVTDSSAYLPQEIVEQYHLPILPLVLNWQGKQYRDGVDISAHEFYTQLSRSKEMASTSQVTVGQFEEIFKPLLEIRGGKIEAVESVISHKKALSRMLDLIEKRTSGKTPLLIAPFHALCEDECRALEAAAVERLHPDEVFRSEVSPVIGAHVGPGTVAIAWMAG